MCGYILRRITENEASVSVLHAGRRSCLVTTQTLSSTHARARATLRGGGTDKTVNRHHLWSFVLGLFAQLKPELMSQGEVNWSSASHDDTS